MNWQAHQGDVFIERIDHIPSGVKPAKLDQHGRAVLAYGEATGHLHAIHGEKIKFFYADGRGAGVGDRAVLSQQEAKLLFLELPKGGDLYHETGPGQLTTDHAPIQALEPGSYKVTRQTEAPWQGMPRIVQD